MTDRAIDPYWFQGGEPIPGKFELKRIYICHIPKTGTTTLYSSLLAAYELQYKLILQRIPDAKLPRNARIDAPPPKGAGKVTEDFALVASHNPFGYHELFLHPFQLITVVRDPYRRVLSSYTYDCMRKGVMPSGEAFQAWYRDETNRNLSTKQLSGESGDTPINEASLQQALENLTQSFFMYGTTKDIGTIVSTLLRMSAMPNVLADHLNKTEAKFLFDGTSFEDEILSLNEHDQDLYEFVEKAPRLDAAEHVKDIKPNPLTALLHETKNDNTGTAIKYSSIPTGRLLDHLKDGRYPKAEFDMLLEN